MAIAVDTTSTGTGVTATSLTWAHTCTGSNLMLFVGCGIPASDLITGVTYNGVAMTQIKKVQPTAGRFIYLYALNNPATGANNVVVSSSGSDVLRGAAVSYTGVKQSVSLDSSNTAIGNSTTPSASTTVIANNSWLIGVGVAPATITAGTGTTKRADFNPSGTEAIFDSNGTVGTGSQSLNMTSGSGNWGVNIASFTVPSVGNSGFFLL